MPKLTSAQIAVLISLVALLASGLTFYFNFLRKGKPKFVCSSFTALGMENKEDSAPRLAFAVKVRVINNGKFPLILKDIILVARHNADKEIIKYEPILLFDFQKYTEHQGKANRIGCAQSGQVTLPLAIPADESYDFAEHILFLPVDKKTMIEPLHAKPAEIRLYALTNRSLRYKLIGKQVFPVSSIENIKMGTFSSVISDESTEERETFFSQFEWETKRNLPGELIEKIKIMLRSFIKKFKKFLFFLYLLTIFSP